MLKIEILSSVKFDRLMKQLKIDQSSMSYIVTRDVVVCGIKINAAALKHKVSKQLIYQTLYRLSGVKIEPTEFEKAIMDRFHEDQWSDLAEIYL